MFSFIKLNWHYWHVFQNWKDLVATQKLEKFETTKLFSQLTKNSSSVWAFQDMKRGPQTGPASNLGLASDSGLQVSPFQSLNITNDPLKQL